MNSKRILSGNRLNEDDYRSSNESSASIRFKSKLPVLVNRQQKANSIGLNSSEAAKLESKSRSNEERTFSSLNAFKTHMRANKNSLIEQGEIKMNKSLNKILNDSKVSGQLNLSGFNLTEVPQSVWRINIEQFDQSDKRSDLNWWQQIDLQKLILASNKIKSIPKDISQIESLITLDIHDNQIASIDEEIGNLAFLKSINLSHNEIQNLPNSICKLKNLVLINASYNALTTLPKNIGYLDLLEDLNLSNNLIIEIPKSFGFFNKLRNLNLSSNQIKVVIPEVVYSINLKCLDLSNNQFDKLPEDIGKLINLEQLYLRQNRIRNFPSLEQCCSLKELDLSYNQLTNIDQDAFKNLASLTILNVRDNKIAQLSSDIKLLKKLERLDLTNNDLINLPPEIALLENLKQLLLTGNSLRAIRKDILNRGTEAIIKSLKMHLEIFPSKEEDDKSLVMNELRPDVIKTTRIIDLSGKKTFELPENFVSFCQKCTVCVINISKNSIKNLPKEIEALGEQITEFIYSLNQLEFIPLNLFKLTNIIRLDLRGNFLTDIQRDISKLDQLRELVIADNRFVEIPDSVFDIKNLETLFVDGNKIQSINVTRLMNLKHLTTLNMQNNEIMQLPPELGLCKNIRSLHLEGNPFRIPRPAILAKGTSAILEFLRGRIVS